MAKNFADVIAEWLQPIEDWAAINNAWDNPVILEGTWENGMSIDPVTRYGFLAIAETQARQ